MRWSRVLMTFVLLGNLLCSAFQAVADDVPKVAAVVTEYRHNSHADVIVSRLLQGYTLDGNGEFPKLELVSLYTDQVPQNDTSRQMSRKHGFPIFDSVEKALTLGTGELAVDGVLLVAEHGDYPKSATGQTVYPKRRLFTDIVKVFEKSGRPVPVFCDKHLADNWRDAKWIYDTSRRLDFPMMAGSSLPTLWRYPPANVRAGAKLDQLVAISYHTLDSYGFHALEMVQSLVERRNGGEVGVKSVRCLDGDAVWAAGRKGVYDQKLLDAAFSRLKQPRLRAGKTLQETVKQPSLCVIDYNDGLRANVLTLNGAVAEWSAAWREADTGRVGSTLFWTQEARPFMHFSYLLKGIEGMIHTGRSTWPVERTLLTSGVLHALHVSRTRGGRAINTPYLNVEYSTDWTWTQPPPPPTGRPIRSQ